MALMTMTEKYRNDLLALVERYKAISGKADSSVSMGAFPSDSEFVRRLRRGKNFTIYKAQKLEDYIEGKFEEIRRQVASGPHSLHRPEEVRPVREAASEHPSPGRSKKSRPFTDGDGASYWA